MPGNTFGKNFTITSAGESHGVAYCAIIDGCPAKIKLSATDIQQELDRRKPGTSKLVSQRKEADLIEIISGVYQGMTTGTPIGLLVRNTDAKPQDYKNLENSFRPGHADFTYQKKYGRRDPQGGGRASARETLMRVAAGAIAKKYLFAQHGTFIRAWISSIGEVNLAEPENITTIKDNDFFCANPADNPKLTEYLNSIRKQQDSIGARINIAAINVPCGLGEPVFDRLDADIAKALMSIPAVKGVEIGAGFNCITQLGSTHRDKITPSGFVSNHAGGILGGISTGQTISASIAIKPTSSIPQPTDSIDTNNNKVSLKIGGRHDTCVGIRAVPIAEAMLALVLMDHLLRDRGQNS